MLAEPKAQQKPAGASSASFFKLWGLLRVMVTD